MEEPRRQLDRKVVTRRRRPRFVFALDSDSEQLVDALLVSSEHLGAALDALIEYWVAEQEKVDDENGVVQTVRDLPR